MQHNKPEPGYITLIESYNKIVNSYRDSTNPQMVAAIQGYDQAMSKYETVMQDQQKWLSKKSPNNSKNASSLLLDAVNNVKEIANSQHIRPNEDVKSGLSHSGRAPK